LHVEFRFILEMPLFCGAKSIFYICIIIKKFTFAG
jgi:hypothetical protein